MIRHPSKRTLRSWLDGDSEADVDSHLATCERCASHLETISEPRSDGAISSTLRAILAPPEDLSEKIESRVIERLDSRQVLGYMADLFGAGFETSKLFLFEDLSDD